MSTISIAPVFTPRPAKTKSARVRPVMRLTRRGRVVLFLALLAGLLTVMVMTGGLATATQSAGSPEPVRIVQVAPGDTLYGIAGEVAEPGQVREMVQRIRDLNSLPGGNIQVGQRLAVPRG